MKTTHRLGVFATSLLLFAALSGVVGNAASTITTPNSATISYTLSPGATSTPVSPATNQPVIVIGANTTTSDIGVSSMTLVRSPGKMMRWVGLEAGTGTVVHNGTASLGAHMLWLDNSNKVALQVFSADQFVIHNGNSVSETGSVKLIW